MTCHARGQTRIELLRLGQAGFGLRAGHDLIYIDPFLSPYPGRLIGPALTPDELSQATAVLVTHEHADHFDTHALAQMPSSATVLVVPQPLAGQARDLVAGRHPVVEALAGRRVELGSGITVTPIASWHGHHVSDAYSFGTTTPDQPNPFLGYIVDMAGTRVYHAGDTILYERLPGILRSHRIDVALLPINGRDPQREALDIVGNLTVDEACDLAHSSDIPLMIPMHYDMFDNNRGPIGAFVDRARVLAPATHVLIPALGRWLPLPQPCREWSSA